MDCEKFQAAMLDELDAEVEEITSAALKRHVSSCSVCAASLKSLRSTRGPARVPLIEPPMAVDGRILAPAATAATLGSANRSGTSGGISGARFARYISLAGNWAMRPQTAMAALFLVMIGTSVLLLREKSSRAPANAEITVTERGSPAPNTSATISAFSTAARLYPEPSNAGALPAAASEHAPSAAAKPLDRWPALPPASSNVNGAAGVGRGVVAADDPRSKSASAALPAARSRPPALGAPNPARDTNDALAGATGPATPAVVTTAVASAPLAASDPAPFAAAVSAYQAGRYEDARRAFDALSSNDPTAGLWAARSLREQRGCAAAVARFDDTVKRATDTPSAWDALLEGGRCYEALGNYAAARTRLEPLLAVGSYADRARAELDRIDRALPSSHNP